MTPARRSTGRGSARDTKRASPKQDEVAEPSGQRLQKILASAGLASRRGAEAYLRAGRVTVNGEPAKLGDSADPGVDVVLLDGEAVHAEGLRYWVLHKPRGMLTTLRDPEGRPTVVGLLPPGLPRLFPVGRLDADTSGLVLVTNDGPLAHRLLHPSLGNPREYRVSVRGEISQESLGKLERGVRLEEGWTSPAAVSSRRYDPKRESTVFRLVLAEGRKRQIRRSLEVLGHPVKRLTRTGFGPIRLGSLRVGASRELFPDELRTLRAHAAALEAKPPPRRRRQRTARTR